MAGNRAGGLKAAQTNKTKHGSDFYQRIGSKAQAAWERNGRKPRGFAVSGKAREAGLKGGLVRGENYRTRIFKPDPEEFGEGFDQATWKDKLMKRIR